MTTAEARRELARMTAKGWTVQLIPLDTDTAHIRVVEKKLFTDGVICAEAWETWYWDTRWSQSCTKSLRGGV